MLLGLGAAKADVVTMTPTAVSGSPDLYTFTCTSDPATGVPDFVFTAKKNNGSTPPTYNKNNKDIRIYAKGDFIITASEGIKITDVVFTLSSQGKKRYPAITVDNGTIATQAKGDTELKWNGSASTITFTVGDKAIYGNTTTDAGQFCFTSFKITYEADDPSDTRGAADIKFAESTYYANEGETFTAPVPTKATTAALTYTSSKPEVATVDANTGAVAIVGSGKTVITASAAENTEFKAGEASYTLEVLKVVNSLAETMAVTDATMKLRINYPLVLAFKNKTNNFVCNGNDFIQIYGAIDYNVGDVIPAGWVGNYELFKDATPEITNPTGMQPSTENNGFTPAKANFADITVADVNKVMTIENVVFAEATAAKGDVSGTVDGNAVKFYNNYQIASVPAGTYNVTFVVSIFNNAPSLYVTNYEKVDDTTGIADIVADENAPVEYFNLQGIRVDNPENGLYIRRQGNKVTKVIVK